MKNSKAFLLLIFMSQLLKFVSAQSIPTLSADDFIKKQDIKKKVGWIKIELDSNFRETKNPGLIKHIYYDFVDIKGNLVSTYRGKIAFPKNVKLASYEPTNDKEENAVINGTLKLLLKNGGRIEYKISEGFILKVCEYRKNNTKKIIIEYIPGKDNVELYANMYSKDGSKIEYDSHEKYDGFAYTTLGGAKDIKFN